MKKTLFAFLCLLAFTVSGQVVTVVETSRLLQGVEGPAYYPVLNDAGDRLLFSSGENGTLKLYDFASNVVSRVSDGFVAGNDAFFGGDGNVYFVTQERGQGNLIYRTGHAYNTASGQSRVVLEAKHGAVRPAVGTRGGALKSAARNYSSSPSIGTAVWTQGSKVFVTVDGQDRVFSPVDSWAGYLWASLSPDGQRVAFFAAEQGIVVIDLRGQVTAMLGRYEMPCWYNDHYLVAQNATDDGHQFTSSQIVLLKADGTFKAELTRPTSMTMQPTCGGGRIVYTTIDGNLTSMRINIDE